MVPPPQISLQACLVHNAHRIDLSGESLRPEALRLITVDMPLRLDNANRVAHSNNSRKQQVWPQS